MKRLIVFMALALTACASDIMQGYVGRDVTAVIATYGQPYRQFDLPDGRVAYQWRIVEFSARPHETYYYEETSGRRVTGQISRYDGYLAPETCYYTFYTAVSGSSARIVGFERPSFDCE